MFDEIFVRFRLRQVQKGTRAVFPRRPQSLDIKRMKGTQSTPPLTLCRYCDGKLERESHLVENTNYLAISHVWGQAEWQRVPGIEGQVLVSKEKAKFLSEQLSSVVGEEYFWMDILCIDQRNKAERIAVTQHIPTIFRQARRTIVLRESNGFRICCLSHLEFPRSGSLYQHFTNEHEGDDFSDGVFSRLWLLQEIMISDTIQFVSCHSARSQSRKDNVHLVGYEEIVSGINGLFMLTAAWTSYGNRGVEFTSSEFLAKHEAKSFIDAYCRCSTVSRRSNTFYFRPSVPNRSEFMSMLSSRRRTSKPRDFVLAVMPQYSFYKVPLDAKSMSFGEIFADCGRQLLEEGEATGLAPLFMGRDHAGPNRFSISTDIPIPILLADFVKLFFGPIVDPTIRVHRVHLENISSKLTNFIDILELLRGQTVHSKYTWTMSRTGELVELSRGHMGVTSGVVPSRVFNNGLVESESGDSSAISEMESMRDGGSLRGPSSGPREAGFLHLMSILPKNENEILGRLSDQFQHLDSSVLIRLAALINCGVGVSAFEWSKSRFIEVLVKFRGEQFLALAPKAVMDKHTDFTL